MYSCQIINLVSNAKYWTTLPVCDILGVEESLMTIGNGGQVANWSRLQHNRTTSFGGKMCYNYNLSKYGYKACAIGLTSSSCMLLYLASQRYIVSFSVGKITIASFLQKTRIISY